MEIRAASLADADQGSELLRRSIIELCHADHGGDADKLAGWIANKTPNHWRNWVDMPTITFTVAVDGPHVLGVGMIDHDGRILLNYVSPDARFRGVTKRLLAHMEDDASRRGLDQTRLESTRTARAFYEAAGYEPDVAAVEQGDWMRKGLR